MLITLALTTQRTSAKALGSYHNQRSTHTHASCTHNDDVVDGSFEAASGHACYNNNKQTNKTKNDQPRRQLSAWQHQHATVH